jgi:hypothetical protein
MEATSEMTVTVLYGKRDRIALVTLNRPAAKNALEPPMHDELLRQTELVAHRLPRNSLERFHDKTDPAHAGTTPTAL